MKVIIAGSRTITDSQVVKNILDYDDTFFTEIVSGHAKGVDQLAEQWGINIGVSVKIFRANWNEYGKAAGTIRNKEMGDYADSLIAIWDGKSRGTKHMIDYMTSLGKPVKVYNV